MRKTIVLLGIIGLLASCKKECEKEETAIVKITNSGDLRAYVFWEDAEHAIEVGESKSFEVDLSIPDSNEQIEGGPIGYRWEGSGNLPHLNKYAFYNQCQTTEVILEK